MKKSYFLIILILAMLAWGGSWTSVKFVSESVESEVVAFWRFFFTFISFIPIIIGLKQSIKLNKRGILQVVIGSLFLVAYNIFFLNGVRQGLAGEGGVIVTTLNPVFTFLFLILFFKQKLGTKEAIGLSTGLIGGLILFKVWNVMQEGLNAGYILLLFAAISWALLSITSQKSKEQMSAFVFSFYTYGIAALIDFFIALPKGVFELSQINLISWANILYLSIAATTFGTTAYFYATSKLGAQKASTFTFLVPSSAVLFSWIFIGEEIQIETIIGGMLALMAVYVLNHKIRDKKLA